MLTGGGATGNDQRVDRSHYPYTRRLKLGWRRTAEDQWVADGEDAERWEVVCTQCGDTDGPVEEQAPPVQPLRGPYESRHEARHAEAEHFREWSPPTRWLAGSAFPDSL
jgi:hypothetical protein